MLIQTKYFFPSNLNKLREIKKLKNTFFHCCTEPTEYIIPFKIGKLRKNIGLCEYHKRNPNSGKYKIEKEFQNYNSDSSDKLGLDAFL